MKINEAGIQQKIARVFHGPTAEKRFRSEMGARPGRVEGRPDRTKAKRRHETRRLDRSVTAAT
jgi:hypothetical protein